MENNENLTNEELEQNTNVSSNDEPIENTDTNTTNEDETSIDTPVNENESEVRNSSDEPIEFNTVSIEQKLDNIIALENQQTFNSLLLIGLLSAVLVIYLLYKFITNFFEF